MFFKARNRKYYTIKKVILKDSLCCTLNWQFRGLMPRKRYTLQKTEHTAVHFQKIFTIKKQNIFQKIQKMAVARVSVQLCWTLTLLQHKLKK